MSLLDGALSFGREYTVSRFTETFEVYTETKTLNNTTGEYTTTRTLFYEGLAGQVKFPTLTVSEREQGSQVPAAQDIVIKVAVGSATNVKVNHLWLVTASTVDASLVGRVFRTKGLAQSGQVTAHRFPVESVA